MRPFKGAYSIATLVLTFAATWALQGAGANDNSPKIRHRSANVKSTKTMICPLKKFKVNAVLGGGGPLSFKKY